MSPAFAVLALCAIALGIDRMARFRDEPVTLTQKSITVALFSMGIAAAAYATTSLTNSFYDIGSIVWHVAACVLIGALEVTFLTLRVEQVWASAVHRIVVRSVTLSLLFLISWPVSQLQGGIRNDVAHFADHTFPSFVSLVIFPLYVIWGLSQVVLLTLLRAPKDIRRRPINTVALILISAGLCGFIWVNAVLTIYLNTGRAADSGDVLAFSPLALGTSIAGAALLAGGERVFEDVSARIHIARLRPLWSRAVELSAQDFHLPINSLSAPARLQRAYVEISDAICTLRIDATNGHDLTTVAASLKRGACAEEPSSPTISEALPHRDSRREDLELIDALAKEYRLIHNRSPRRSG